jgi:hypothetical protein
VLSTSADRLAAQLWEKWVSNENQAKYDAATAKLTDHLKNIDIACDDARLSAVEKIRRIKEEIEKAQECLKTMSDTLSRVE